MAQKRKIFAKKSVLLSSFVVSLIIVVSGIVAFVNARNNETPTPKYIPNVMTDINIPLYVFYQGNQYTLDVHHGYSKPQLGSNIGKYSHFDLYTIKGINPSKEIAVNVVGNVFVVATKTP